MEFSTEDNTIKFFYHFHNFLWRIKLKTNAYLLSLIIPVEHKKLQFVLLARFSWSTIFFTAGDFFDKIVLNFSDIQADSKLAYNNWGLLGRRVTFIPKWNKRIKKSCYLVCFTYIYISISEYITITFIKKVLFQMHIVYNSKLNLYTYIKF